MGTINSAFEKLFGNISGSLHVTGLICEWSNNWIKRELEEVLVLIYLQRWHIPKAKKK